MEIPQRGFLHGCPWAPCLAEQKRWMESDISTVWWREDGREKGAVGGWTSLLAFERIKAEAKQGVFHMAHHEQWGVKGWLRGYTKGKFSLSLRKDVPSAVVLLTAFPGEIMRMGFFKIKWGKEWENSQSRAVLNQLLCEQLRSFPFFPDLCCSCCPANSSL